MTETIIDFLLMYLYWINPHAVDVVSIHIFIFSYLGLSPIIIKDDMTFSQIVTIKLRHISLLVFTVLVVLLPIFAAAFSMKVFDDRGSFYIHSLVDEHQQSFFSFSGITILFCSIGISILTKLGFYRIIVPQYNAMKRQLRAKQSGEELSDIRVEKDELRAKNFDPTNYYKEGYFFYGLDKNKQPIYDSEAEWKEQNQKIIGPTRTGKGVHIGVQIDQAIRKNMNVFVIDPKPDNNLKKIMQQTCEATNRKFIAIDLNDNNNGLWHPFTGGKPRNRRSRLLYALGLNDTGNESDFYKTKERNIIDHFIQDDWNGKLSQLIHKMEKHKDDIQRSYSIAKEWTYIDTFNHKKKDGFSIADAIENNHVIYIRSSLDDEIVRNASTVFIMELIQELRRLYEEDKKPAHMFVAIDEVRFMVSNLLADALATCVGCGANFLLAYQSLMDIRNISNVTVDVKGLEASLNVNCKTTLCYGASDFDTANWASELSGTIQKSVTRMEKVEVAKYGTEVWDNERTLNRVEVPLITQNQLLMLPSRTGILFRQAKLAEITYTCWVEINQATNISFNHDLKELDDETSDNNANNDNKDNIKSIDDVANI